MSSKRKLLIIAIAVLIAIVVGLLVLNKEKLMKKDDNKDSIVCNDDQLLVVKSHINFAWGFTFYGSAIFYDGSIYTWNSAKSNDEKTKLDLGETEALKEYIKTNGVKKEGKVSEEDLEEIKGYISKLTKKDTDFTLEHKAYDMGDFSFSVYKNDVEISLRESGDYQGGNSTKNIKKLISLTEKYLGE